jgi:hypothetical protein
MNINNFNLNWLIWPYAEDWPHFFMDIRNEMGGAWYALGILALAFLLLEWSLAPHDHRAEYKDREHRKLKQAAHIRQHSRV